MLHRPFDDHAPRSTLAKVHRALIAARARITDGAGASLVEECLRGERIARARYQALLATDLPANIARVLREHLADICEAERILEAGAQR